MSFTRYVGIGFLTGTVSGIVSSEYFAGLANRYDKKNGPLAYSAFGASIISLPFLMCAGTGAGASFYVIKKSVKIIRSAPLPIRILIYGTAATSIGATAAYRAGNGSM